MASLSFQLREQLVSRIISGRTKIKFKGRLLYVAPPTTHIKTIGDELYSHVYEQSIKKGLYNDAELQNFLIQHGYWSLEEDDRADGLEKDIEEMKIKLYQLNFQSNERAYVRSCLKNAKEELRALQKKKCAFDYLGAESVANSARQKYIVGHSLYTMSMKKFPFKWNKCDDFDEIMYGFYGTRLKNECFRELAHTEPWTSMSAASRYCKPIFKNVFTLTEEQRALITWSSIYENVRQHPECPPESILDDDDCMDGWLILQRRKHSEQHDRQHAESLIGSSKIRSSEEIFIIADTIEDVSKIDNLNDAGSRMLKRQKLKKVASDGNVFDDQMPDSKQKIRTMATQQYKQQVYRK